MWFERIRKVLGKLWATLFNDYELVHGLLKIFATSGEREEQQTDKWLLSMTASGEPYRCMGIPYSVDLEIARTAVDGTRTELIVHPEYDLDYCIENNLSYENGIPRDPTAGWCVKLPKDTQLPDIITESMDNGKHLLVVDMDFHFENGWIVFTEDPRYKDFARHVEVLPDGTVVEILSLVCRKAEQTVDSDLVGGLVDRRLAGVPEPTWDMHVKGATMYNTKHLLAEASNSVVSSSIGTIISKWTEGDLTCMLIDTGDLYTYNGPPSECLDVGTYVKYGDILAGSLRVYDFNDAPPPSEVPALLVRTDVGALLAVNEDDVPTTDTGRGCKILPLRDSGESTTNEEYANLVAERSTDDMVPKADIPDTVNPMLYVACNLRAGRQVFVTLNETTDIVEAALDAVRKSISAGAMLTVYVKAVGDDAVTDLVQDFTAEIGMVAVASYATINATIGNAETSTI